MTVPALAPAPPFSLPASVDERLPNGLRVVAVRRGGIPLVELRLRIPFGALNPRAEATSRLIAATLLSGTRTRDLDRIGADLEALGAAVLVDVDADRLLVTGTVRSGAVGAFLDLLHDILVNATFPAAEVANERDRLIQQLRLARSRAAVQAHETLHRHLFDGHPYSRALPNIDDVAAVTAEDLRELHRRLVVPAGSVLILVGDLDTGQVPEIVSTALGSWRTTAGAPDALPNLPTPKADPSVLVHRANSVQSSIRLGGTAAGRDDPSFPALQVANLLYGGYFSSRLVANIREDKGYTYTPRSRIEHSVAGSMLMVEADVATGVTAPALLEMWYELGRLSTLRPTEQELADARQYAAGNLASVVSTQAGLASTLDALIGVGLDLAWIPVHLSRLREVTADDIYRIGVHVLAPNRLAVVVIGDATATAEPLKAFGPWEVRW